MAATSKGYAALDMREKTIGLGIVARDDRGFFMAAYCKHQAIEVDPVVAKALAILHVVIFCHKQGYQIVIFEGGALQIVNAVNLDHPCNSMYGHLVEDIKTGLQGLVL